MDAAWTPSSCSWERVCQAFVFRRGSCTAASGGGGCRLLGRFRFFGGLRFFLLLRTFSSLGLFGTVSIFSHRAYWLETIGRHDILHAAVPVVIVLQAEPFVVIIFVVPIVVVPNLDMAPADVQVDPVIAFDGIIHHDLFSHRDIDGKNDLLVTEFLVPGDRKSVGCSWRTLSDWLTGKSICRA